jgi:tagatose-1,6-bisphosphate aldolase
MGASAVKLLVYYHPESPAAGDIEALVRRVADDCASSDMLFFLEPLSYSHDPAMKKLAPDERRFVVLESARRLTPLGVDVLKAEFPLDIAAYPDERDWENACLELSGASVTPWVLLWAGADYDTYVRQVTVACHAGASGIAAGRAIWQEAAGLNGASRLEFLRNDARQRLMKLAGICQELAHPWSAYYGAPHIAPDWYKI